MAKTYSHDLKVGDRLDKLSDSAMKATDEGFYGTASVKELVGWKVSKVFRETKDVAEDKIYGGFCYMIATKDDQMIMAFRGSFGNQKISKKENRGDWHHNFASYPFGTDPGGAWAELAAEAPLNVNAELKKLYITGHSRAGMLAQRAGAKMVELGKDELLQRLTYFNGLGVIMELSELKNMPFMTCDYFTGVPVPRELDSYNLDFFVSSADAIIVKNLYNIRDRIFSVGIIGEIKDPFPYVDAVTILGMHVGARYTLFISDVAQQNNADDAIKAYHSMSNFTHHMLRGKVGGQNHV